MGELYLGSHYNSERYYPGDTPPPYSQSYQLQGNATLEYKTEYVEENQVCDIDDIGCKDDRYLYIRMDNRTYSLRSSVILEFGESFVERFEIKDDNNIQYEYSKTEYGRVCEFEQCETSVSYQVYDLDGELIYNSNRTETYTQGQQTPLIKEFRMTENTILEVGSTCADDSCGQWYHQPDYNFGFNLNYEYGDQKYSRIEFVESDYNVLYEKTYTREVCSDIEGCWIDDVTYIINDAEGNELYKFSDTEHVEYGHKLPYKATMTLDDVEIIYQRKGEHKPVYCQEETCRYDVEIVFVDGDNWNHMGSVSMTFNQGEEIIRRMLVDNDTISPFESSNVYVCQNEEGCSMGTNNYIILDESGQPLPLDEERMSHIQLKFDYQEEMPVDNSFQVTLQLSDVVYEVRRVEPYHIFSYMESFTILEENLFYIESPHWDDGETNYILSYNEEENTYLASYTNLPAMHEIAKLGNGYVGINNDKTAIYYFELDSELSNENFYHYQLTNLTENEEINAVNNLIIDYDGSIYFEAVDNFIQEITGKIAEDGTITIDTVYTEYEIVRVRPIN